MKENIDYIEVFVSFFFFFLNWHSIASVLNLHRSFDHFYVLSLLLYLF